MLSLIDTEARLHLALQLHGTASQKQSLHPIALAAVCETKRIQVLSLLPSQ